jgi:hypothetical protein
MLIVLAASVPIYVCATGSIPIAAVLMMKGLSPGAALVFLMAGPATNAATMAVIGKAINKKTMLVYLSTIIISAMFFGWLTNLFLPAHWFTLVGDHSGHEHELIPYWLKLVSGIALILLIVNGYIRKYFVKQKVDSNLPDMAEHVESIKVKVTGMTCNHCKMSAENSILKVNGIKKVVADPDKSEVYIEGDIVDLGSVKRQVEDVGFTFHGKVD